MASGSSSYLVNVPKLKGRENYSDWCFAAENFLVLEGMVKCIKPESGIIHQKSNPYTPEQNGLCERMNRTVIEKARCLLFEAKLDKKFWAEAVNTAVFLQNRIVKTGLNNRTPYELWTNKKPNLSHIRVFGSIVMKHIPKEKRHKLDKKSEKCILVGYPDDVKGYRIYNPVTHTITTSRDVIIIEDNKIHQENLIVVQEEDKKPETSSESQILVGDNNESSHSDSFISMENADLNDVTYVPSEESITDESCVNDESTTPDENFEDLIPVTLPPRTRKNKLT